MVGKLGCAGADGALVSGRKERTYCPGGKKLSKTTNNGGPAKKAGQSF